MKTGLPRSSAVLLHPMTLAALALWAINDHLLKGWAPSALTGKLSDVAGLVVAPSVLLGLVEWCAPSLPERHLRATLTASCAAVGLLLMGLELWRPIELAYQHALGSAQFAVRTLIAALCAERGPDYALVHTTADLTDLFTLPALAVPWCLVTREGARSACACGVAKPWSPRATDG